MVFFFWYKKSVDVKTEAGKKNNKKFNIRRLLIEKEGRAHLHIPTLVNASPCPGLGKSRSQ